ncbi:MAG: MMPL family transporter [Aestuariivita sp.]|nr:MMPL family transporter [Aestuariivita sp.]MCY4201180.1 MMPL family transporter [Aestuariivita sp.]
MDSTSYLDKHVGFVIGHRNLTILLCLIVILICMVKIGSLTNSNNFRDLVDKNNPELIAYDTLDNIYAHSSANSILIAIAPQTRNIFNRETLAIIEELTERAWLLPYASRVESLTNYSHSSADGDDLIIEPLIQDSRALRNDDLQRVSEIALTTPELKSRLVSENGHVGGLLINFAIPNSRTKPVDEVNDSLEDLTSEMQEKYTGVEFYALGEMVTNRALSQTTESELKILVPVALFVILMASWLFSRSALLTSAVFLLMVFTVGAAMGVAGWFQIVLTPISAYIPIVLMAFSVAYSIHIITGTTAGLQRGLQKAEAIAGSIKENAYPVFLTSATTTIGFISLNFSDLPPFRTLGNFVAIGVGLNFLFSMTFLPAFLAILPLRTSKIRTSILDAALLHLGNFVVLRRKLFLVVMCIISITFSVGIFRIELSDNFVEYYGERHEYRRNMEFVIDNFTGLDTQEYSLDSKQEGGITDPSYLEKIDMFAQWYRQQPGVHHVWSFSDIMKRLNQNLNGDDPEYYRLPNDRALATQYLLLYELSLPFGQDLSNSINVAKSATRMVVTLRNLTSREQRELAERGYSWLEANAPDLLTKAAGFSVVISNLSERSVRSMLSGTAIAAAIVSLLLLLVFRSIRYGLVSLVPNFLPGIVALGLWGYFVGNIGIAAAVFVVISFGIIVDDTIHFMSRYLNARRISGASPQEAVCAAFTKTGRALFTTTVVLALGFGVFVYSSFQPNWSLGGLVTASIVLALLMDFLLLPPLLILLDRKKDVAS